VHKVLVITSLFILPFFCKAQMVTLSIKSENNTSYIQLPDSPSILLELQEKIDNYRTKGFIAASIDSTKYANDTVIAFLNHGLPFTHMEINTHNLPEEYIGPSKKQTLDLITFSKLQEKVMQDYENKGFPFVAISLTEPKIKEDTLVANIILDPYIQFVYDTIVILGNSSLSKKYLCKYLEIEEGTLYNEQNIKEIDTKLENSPLVKVKSKAQVLFFRGRVRIILNIDDNAIDRFDGIVGLAPNSSNADENSLLITGELNVGLNNLFKSGKQLQIQWKNYLKNSQKLNLSATIPYLFNSKFGVNGEFKLNKFDTLFLNLNSQLSIRYQKNGNNYIQFYYQNIQSNLLSVDTNSIRLQERIPSNNPFNIDNYGLSIFQKKVDYLNNPREGFAILTDLAIGQKTIKKNRDINNMKFFDTQTGKTLSLYDTIKLKQLRLNAIINLTSFIPIKEKSTIHQNLSFRGLFSDQVFFNELYNFGGYSTLKGFDENEFFASKSLIYTLEYRYLIGTNSYIGLFINAAAYEDKLKSSSLIYDTPLGFGLSSSLEIGQGILNISYALGSQNDNGFQLGSAKIHFGIINYF
tara:strand:- start:17442 stop:19181 length:1740 start_codon:yes stop_codon:yes gene_type:complete